ncbi:D-glycero-alpha-D-manno-heptose-1,7-bisphosphate 7-phosphatase [Curtobacterium ammoniigenes]|uniref:D-glycero-alpha-D-manno-heptose-1,7-bisphosphate 7-phosphatase n=1 Tax=Curtobacterium ammoniigenes TaxID=395387 RepID=UPI000A650BBA|nr:HAD family hydrolase [Curtobacterium ammoniigenes]
MSRIPSTVRAVFFDRDGTLVHDVPYNGDPGRVEPVAGARRAVAAVRAAGLATAVVTNQSGIARGIVSRDQVDAVNDRVEALLGPFDAWEVCPHGPDAHCACRKPQPGMIVHAAEQLGVSTADVVMIGDIGADVAAARAAGAASILVPTDVTRVEEVEAAEIVADTLVDAVALVLHAARAVSER